VSKMPIVGIGGGMLRTVGAYVEAPEIVDGAITTAKLADLAVTGAKIANKTIPSGKLAATAYIVPTYADTFVVDSTGKYTLRDIEPAYGTVTKSYDATGALKVTTDHDWSKWVCCNENHKYSSAIYTMRLKSGTPVTPEYCWHFLEFQDQNPAAAHNASTSYRYFAGFTRGGNVDKIQINKKIAGVHTIWAEYTIGTGVSDYEKIKSFRVLRDVATGLIRLICISEEGKWEIETTDTDITAPGCFGMYAGGGHWRELYVYSLAVTELDRL